jgi:hypothetical protein
MALVLLAAAGTAFGAAPTAGTPDLPSLRAGFPRAVGDPAAADALAAAIEGQYGSFPDSFPPVIHAYYASLEGLKAMHARDIFEKVRRARRAIALFSGLVEAHPDSLEIRFLRFTLFSRLPPLFGVRHDVPADLAVIIDRLRLRLFDEVPSADQHAMTVYLLENAELDRENRRRLQELEEASAGG